MIPIIFSGCITSSADHQSTPTPTSTPQPTPQPTPTYNASSESTASSSSLSGSAGSPTLNVYYINVGQGDSELITIGNKSMLIDGGVPSEGSTVSSFLTQHGVSTIDVLVLTHPHDDHAGGLPTVMGSHQVKQVVDSGQVNTIQSYEDYLNIIDTKKIPYKAASAGYTIDFNPLVTVQVLNPPSTPISAGDNTLNENSVVIKLAYNNVTFLFEGDAGTDAESRMISSGYNLKADILKVGHHGSKYSSSPSFIAKVSPNVSIIEVGHNDYGHPAPNTIQTLQNIGSKVYTTLDNGDIQVATNGTTYTVTPEYSSNSITAGSTQDTQPTTSSLTTLTPTPLSSPVSDVLTGYQGAVIGNKNTKVYHNAATPCVYYEKMSDKNKVCFDTRAEAEAAGYHACSYCDWS